MKIPECECSTCAHVDFCKYKDKFAKAEKEMVDLYLRFDNPKGSFEFVTFNGLKCGYYSKNVF